MKDKFNLPFFKHFYANTFLKAFILNAFALGVISALSIETRIYLDYVGKQVKSTHHLTDFTKTVIVFISAFIVGTVIYLLMYIFVGFGGGMLTAVPHWRPLTKPVSSV